MKGSSFTTANVQKIATLATIPVTDKQAEELASGFTKTMSVVDELNSVDVQGVPPTNQVTGLENVFRDDEIDVSRILPLEEVLKNAKRTHNGFFVVDQILDE